MKFSMFAGAILISLSMLGLPTEAHAQRYRKPPIAQRQKWAVRSIIDHAERESNTLRDIFEHKFKQYNLGRLNTAENARAQIQGMDEAFEDLRGVADDNHPWRGKDEMMKVVTHAKNVDRIFSRHHDIQSTVSGHWWKLREDINQLARIYGIAGLGR